LKGSKNPNSLPYKKPDIQEITVYQDIKTLQKLSFTLRERLLSATKCHIPQI